MNLFRHSTILFSEHVAASFVLQLFFLSTALLVVGLSCKVWFHAMVLVWIDSMTLDTLEKEHPYIPNMKIITKVAIATASLVIIGTFLITNFSPFNETYEFLYLFGVFAIVGAFSILSELHWQEYKWFLFAILAASSLAYVLFALRYFIENQLVAPTLFFLGFLLVSITSSWQLLRDVHDKKVNIIFLVTVLWWFTVHFVYHLPQA